MEVRRAMHSDHAKTPGTAELRRHCLVDNLFVPVELALNYSHVYRIIVG